MTKNFNKTIIQGALGRDPEMRYTPEGQAVTSFSVGVNGDYENKKGEKVKKTIWYRASAWGKQAEVCNEYLKKGSKVIIEGRLEPDPETGGPRIWFDQEGKARANFDLTVAEIYFLGSSNSAHENENGKQPSGRPVGSAPANNEDDIPF